MTKLYINQQPEQTEQTLTNDDKYQRNKERPCERITSMSLKSKILMSDAINFKTCSKPSKQYAHRESKNPNK